VKTHGAPIRAERAVRAVLAAQAVRHTIVLANILRVRRFLAGDTSVRHAEADVPEADAADIRCVVVLPMLREQRLAAATVRHFRGLLRGSGDRVYVVTTAREDDRLGAQSTAAIAAALADGDRVRHLHVTDPTGRKGDQVNLAVQEIAGETPPRELGACLVVVYDADSRPPPDSLDRFARAAQRWPLVGVFHQSARFEVRARPRSPLAAALAGAEALRANRFVLAYELPRLLSRSPGAGRVRREAAGVTYGHVAGHGLALRLDAALERPLPSRTPMEDMAYSFDLAVDRVPLVPIDSLDRSEVSASPADCFRQHERWFSGPGRALRYRAAHGRGGMRRELVTVSALLISLEWLSCALALPFLLRLARRGPGNRAARVFLVIYAAELAATEMTLDDERTPAERLRAVAAFPAANMLFGLAAWSSVAGRLLGRALTEKTER
jgi:hypothetical protein